MPFAVFYKGNIWDVEGTVPSTSVFRDSAGKLKAAAQFTWQPSYAIGRGTEVFFGVFPFIPLVPAGPPCDS